MGFAIFSSVFSFFPVFVGVRNARRLNTGLRVLLWWLAFGSAMEVASFVLGRLHIHTILLFLLSYPIYCFLGMGALGHLTGSARLLSLLKSATALYVVFWMYCMLQLEDGADFSSHAGPAMFLLLTVASVVVIVARFRSGVDRPLRDPAILAALATAISSGPLAILDPVSHDLLRRHPQIVMVLLLSRSVLNLVGYLIYALALEWTVPQTP